MTNVQDLLKLADHAAGQGDRWAFFAMLIVNLGGAFLLIRWLINRFSAIIEKVAAVVERNTDQLREVRGSMDWCRARTGAPNAPILPREM